jgi:hypothetical protein
MLLGALAWAAAAVLLRQASAMPLTVSGGRLLSDQPSLLLLHGQTMVFVAACAAALIGSIFVVAGAILHRMDR